MIALRLLVFKLTTIEVYASFPSLINENLSVSTIEAGIKFSVFFCFFFTIQGFSMIEFELNKTLCRNKIDN